MSLGQAIMYLNLGIEIKYGKEDKGDNKYSFANMSPDEVTKVKEELHRLYGDIDNG